MPSLQEDIKSLSDWIVKAFTADGYTLDYTIDSIIEVDRFFVKNMKDGKPSKKGRLAGQNVGQILFAIGSYVGETITKNVSGAEWITDDNDPEGEITATIKLPDGTEMWPMQKVIKRFRNGGEDAIYPYVYTAVKPFLNHPFNERFWKVTAEKSGKPWWKFW